MNDVVNGGRHTNLEKRDCLLPNGNIYPNSLVDHRLDKIPWTDLRVLPPTTSSVEEFLPKQMAGGWWWWWVGPGVTPSGLLDETEKVWISSRTFPVVLLSFFILDNSLIVRLLLSFYSNTIVWTFLKIYSWVWFLMVTDVPRSLEWFLLRVPSLTPDPFDVRTLQCTKEVTSVRRDQNVGLKGERSHPDVGHCVGP